MLPFGNTRSRWMESAAAAALAASIAAAPAAAQNLTTLDVLLPNESTTVFYPHFLCAELGYFVDVGL